MIVILYMGQVTNNRCVIKICRSRLKRRSLFQETCSKVSFKLLSTSLMFVKKLCITVPIDDFRGACAVKGNVQVAGHVKRVDHGDAFNGASGPKWAKLKEYFSIFNVIVTE